MFSLVVSTLEGRYHSPFVDVEPEAQRGYVICAGQASGAACWWPVGTECQEGRKTVGMPNLLFLVSHRPGFKLRF